MSPFEIVMLVCFGAAWPFSIYRSWASRSTSGKSILFLIVVMVGYVAGILHKLYFHYDMVIFLYALNLIMVAIDAGLFFRNKRLESNDTGCK